jgi:hypothetical protein
LCRSTSPRWLPANTEAINIGFPLSITIGIFFANVLNYIFSKFIKGG